MESSRSSVEPEVEEISSEHPEYRAMRVAVREHANRFMESLEVPGKGISAKALGMATSAYLEQACQMLHGCVKVGVLNASMVEGLMEQSRTNLMKHIQEMNNVERTNDKAT